MSERAQAAIVAVVFLAGGLVYWRVLTNIVWRRERRRRGEAPSK